MKVNIEGNLYLESDGMQFILKDYTGKIYTDKRGNGMAYSAVNHDGHNRCANCGKSESESKAAIVGSSMYDGEWCCCEECMVEHDTFGCPFEHGIRYRDMKY